MGEALRAAMNAARRAQDKDRTLVLGTILANLKNREIELRRPTTDDDVVDVLRKGIKTRRESVEQYTAANRPDLAENEQSQIKVLEEFLPPRDRSRRDPRRGAGRHRRRRHGHRQGHGPGDAEVQGSGRRQSHQPDRPRGAAGRLMSSSPLVSPHGVPAHAQGGTPSPLPPGQSARRARDDRVRPGGRARRRARRGPARRGARARAAGPPTISCGSRASSRAWARWPRLFRRGDALLAEPIPDVGRALGRLRIEGSVLEGVDLAALQRVLVAARLMQADLRRVADTAPLAGALARPLPDKALERRLEQSVDTDGSAARHREPPACRRSA